MNLRRPENVAIVALQFPSTSETFLLRQITGLLEAGFDVRIFAIQAGDWSALSGILQQQLRNRTTILRQPGIEGISLKRIVAKLLWNSLFRSASRRQLKSITGAILIKQYSVARDVGRQSLVSSSLGEYQVIVAHFGPAGLLAMFLRQAGLLSGPIATVFHGFDVSLNEVIEANLAGYRKLFKDTELILPVSNFWAKRLQSWGASVEKTHVLRMGVDIGAAEFEADRALGRPLRVLSVGRFVEKKGLVYAVQGVRRCSAPAELTVIGFGEREGEIRSAADGCRNVRIISSPQSHNEVLSQMTRADVFLSPSVVASNGDMEGIPVALMEAMARGCIVVATRHSGIPELIEHGKSGYLVAERSSEAIAGILETIASGKVDLPAMRLAARHTVTTHFNSQSLDSELIRIVRALQGGSFPISRGLRHSLM
jgi:colanic acid/amylovoran biosynthesis glycosyltransferase